MGPAESCPSAPDFLIGSFDRWFDFFVHFWRLLANWKIELQFALALFASLLRNVKHECDKTDVVPSTECELTRRG